MNVRLWDFRKNLSVISTYPTLFFTAYCSKCCFISHISTRWHEWTVEIIQCLMVQKACFFLFVSCFNCYSHCNMFNRLCSFEQGAHRSGRAFDTINTRVQTGVHEPDGGNQSARRNGSDLWPPGFQSSGDWSTVCSFVFSRLAKEQVSQNGNVRWLKCKWNGWKWKGDIFYKTEALTFG